MKKNIKEEKRKLKIKIRRASLVKEALFLEKEINLIIENLIVYDHLQEGVFTDTLDLAKKAFNSIKTEVDTLKNKTADYAYSFLKKSIDKNNQVILTLNTKKFISKQAMRSLQLKMKVFLIPEHAKFLGSVVMAILKSLAISGLQAVMPGIIGVASYEQLKQKYDDFEKRFLSPIKNFIATIDQITAYAEDAIQAGKQALITFCLKFLGIEADEIVEYIPNIEKLIKDLKNPFQAVQSNLGLRAALEEA